MFRVITPWPFTSTAANGFSIDGTTFSVNASTNRVGIGTTTPARALEVNDALKISNNAVDQNDGVIGNSTFSPGLNIVGINPDATNRKIKMWGGITQQQNDGGNTFVGSTTFTGGVRVNPLAGSGDRYVYADSDGDLTTLGSNYRVAYLVDRAEKTHNNANSGFRSVGGTTSNLAVVSGDIIVINVTLKYAFTTGSGGDDVQFRINIGGCTTTSQTETYEHENFDNDRNEYQGVSMQFVYVATCSGNLNFQLFADNNSDADDNSKYGDLVIVATVY